MANKRQSKVQRKSTSRGRFTSFTVHLALLLLAYLPFLSFQAPEPPPKEALVIQFDYPYNQYVAPEKFVEEIVEEKMEMPEEANLEEASKMSGSEGGGNETQAEPMQSRPQPSAPTALSSPSKPTTLKSTSSPLTTQASDIPRPMPKLYPTQAWASVEDVSESETDGVQEMKIIDSGTSFGSADIPSGGDGDDDSGVTSEGFGTKPGGTGGTGNGTGNTTGNGSGPGGGTGTGNAGNKTGVGNNGTGMDYGVGLNGLLNRKIIKQGAIGKLAEKPGKIAMYVCVDQSGKVVGTKYDVVASTITDPAIIAKAEEVARSYVWAADPDAPPKQCGKLTITFTLPK
jgi:hypothetical protein